MLCWALWDVYSSLNCRQSHRRLSCHEDCASHLLWSLQSVSDNFCLHQWALTLLCLSSLSLFAKGKVFLRFLVIISGNNWMNEARCLSPSVHVEVNCTRFSCKTEVQKLLWLKTWQNQDSLSNMTWLFKWKKQFMRFQGPNLSFNHVSFIYVPFSLPAGNSHSCTTQGSSWHLLISGIMTEL